MRSTGLRSTLCGAIILFVFAACAAGSSHQAHHDERPTTITTPPDSSATLFADSGSDAADTADANQDASIQAIVSRDPMDLHKTTREGLLSLFTIKEPDDPKTIAFLENTFGTDGPRKMNQGNKAIARHLIDKATCLDNLRKSNIVVQTPAQRAKCGGHENMVPIWTKPGQEPAYCIDVFEFPNKTCELPMVWTPPTWAKKVCELQGKRLCADTEWNIACRGDPEGGADQRYAYGDKLDLEACNTNLAHRTACNPRGSSTAWGTCSTDTEPSGAFPRCRSRFGVFDQHGNIAEVMTRRDGTGPNAQVVTQLKGSAWFYVELAKEPDKPTPSTTMNKEGAYPDHCNFDPRWHVEPIDQAGHINYHLGFRCCRSVD